MTDKEKQIEEMAVILSPLCDEEDVTSCKACNEKDKERCGECIYREMAEALYDAGYRKQSEVVKEFAGRLKERFEKTSTMATALHGRKESEITSIIDTVAAEYGVEVEK